MIAHRQLARFDAQRVRPEAWLAGIAINVCRHYRRSNRRFFGFFMRVQQEADIHHEDGESPERSMERRHASDIVHAVLDKMPDKHREIFILYELDELNGPEIAEVLSIPLGTVRTRLHHARKRFKREAERLMALSEGAS